jgi:hypothetical protein
VNRKLLVPIVPLILAVLACVVPVELPPLPTLPPTFAAPFPAAGSPPAPAFASPTASPFAPAVASPTPSPAAPSTSGAYPALSVDILRNAKYTLPGCDGPITHTYQLTDGKYQSMADPSSADYILISMAGEVAFGDLNGDGLDDAALVLGVSCGGTGVFESLIVVLNAGGVTQQVGRDDLGDRSAINALTIASARVTLDMRVNGPDDPLCCPTLPKSQTYRLVEDALWKTRVTSRTPADSERAVDIQSPADGATLGSPFTIHGSVTIAPFENTLAYVLSLPDGTQVNSGSLFVDSGGVMGGPGTFSQTFDLSSAGITGTVIVQFLDVSAADGSTLDMDSLVLTVQ